MRIRFEFQSLFSLGLGVHRLPINCWRLTVNYVDNSVGVLLNGTNFNVDLQDTVTGEALLARFVVGGLPPLPDGTIVNLDQILTITAATSPGQGMLIYEYLEP